MDIMTKLRSVVRFRAEIEALRKAKEDALVVAIGGATDYGGSRVQTTKGNENENKFIAYSEYSIALDKKINALEQAELDVINAIYQIPTEVDGGKGSEYRTLLIGHYVNGQPWEDVANKINYSGRQIYRERIRALKVLEECAKKRKGEV